MTSAGGGAIVSTPSPTSAIRPTEWPGEDADGVQPVLPCRRPGLDTNRGYPKAAEVPSTSHVDTEREDRWVSSSISRSTER
jgi:hypothetical protein